MYQQISSIFSTKKSLFSNNENREPSARENNLTIDIDDEYENMCYDNNLVSPPLSRNRSMSSSSSFSRMPSPLSRQPSISSRSRNNSFVGSLFPSSSTSRPTSGRFNFNNLFFNECSTPLSRAPSLDFSRLKRSLSISRESPNIFSHSSSLFSSTTTTATTFTSFSTATVDNELSSRLQRDFHSIELIGTGSFGMVYRAQGVLDGVRYAIKKAGKKTETNEEKSLILREVQALAALSEESESETGARGCIVRYHNSWFEEDFLCIQMELCDSSAAEIYEPLQMRLCYRLLRDILNALEILHRNGFVHLDVKPENILRKRDHFKLAGFGLALQETRRDARSPEDLETIDTRYMASEMLSNEPITDLSKCDIFSLGLTVYGLSTGSLPDSDGAIWHQLRQSHFTFPDFVDPELQSLVMLMTAPHPLHRPSASDCIHGHSILLTPQEIQLKEQLEKIRALEQQLKLLSEQR